MAIERNGNAIFRIDDQGDYRDIRSGRAQCGVCQQCTAQLLALKRQVDGLSANASTPQQKPARR